MPRKRNSASAGGIGHDLVPSHQGDRSEGKESQRGTRLAGTSWDDNDLARRTAVAELAEGIAHDLKNQLTVVAASVQLARDTGAGERQDLLDRAWRSAMRAARLMDDMLRYTRGAEPVAGDADAGEALETAIAAAWGYCGGRRVHLEMRAEPDLPRVAGSASALRVLLLHLLRWAADLSPSNCRLVAAAARAGYGIGISIRNADEVGAILAFSEAVRVVPADLAALAAQTGAALNLGPQGLCVWLRLAERAGSPSLAD